METETTWNAGPISLDGWPATRVLAQFPVNHRWNGWLMPDLDPLSAVQALDALIADGAAYEYDFDADGRLVLIDRGEGEEYVETLSPDADGLYPLGAGAWIWSSEEEWSE